MYQLKQINYKSIFVNGKDKETVEYKVNGVVEKGKMTTISFEVDNNTLEIKYDQQTIYLRNNKSKLKLVRDQIVDNLYQLPYGEVLLKTRLLTFKERENHLGIKYELYDSKTLISTVYITININSL